DKAVTRRRDHSVEILGAKFRGLARLPFCAARGNPNRRSDYERTVIEFVAPTRARRRNQPPFLDVDSCFRGDGIMWKSSALIATTLIACSAMAATSAQSQPGKGGGHPAPAAAPRAAPAPHPAPAPHAAPAPRAAPQASVPRPQAAAPRPAPHIAAPRAAPPHVASPRVAPPHAAPSAQRAAPQHAARPSAPPHPSAPSSAVARHPSGPTPGARARTQEHTIGQAAKPPQSGPAAGATRPNREAGPTAGATAHPNATPQNAIPRQQHAMPQHQPNRAFQPAGSGRAIAGGVLRNPVFADRAAARDPGARQLARATFQGRFFASPFRRHFARSAVFVIGWAGPLFWPYAYDDFVDYTFYAHAYDTFWPYAYDDLYAGMFGPYAEGGAYAAGGRAGRSRTAYAAPGGQQGGRGRPAVATEVCSGQTAGLTDWPIEQIAQAVGPDDTQRAALDELKDAIA